MKVVLIGMPLIGKTSCGKMLAKFLNIPHYDTDKLIETECSQSVSSIFKRYGERFFREMEHNIIKSIAHIESGIVSVGGGAILSKNNNLVLKPFTKIWLLADYDTILARMQQPKNKSQRPILKNTTPSALQDMYEQRLPLYRQNADHIVDTSQLTIKEIVQKIYTILKNSRNPYQK